MPPNSRAVYLRYTALSANDWPCLGVAAFLRKENGRCQEVRIASRRRGGDTGVN